MPKLSFFIMLSVLCTSAAYSATTYKKSILTDEAKNEIVTAIQMSKLTDVEQGCYKYWMTECPDMPKDREEKTEERKVVTRGENGERNKEVEPDPERVAAIECRLEVLDMCNIPLSRFTRPLDAGTLGENPQPVGIGYR